VVAPQSNPPPAQLECGCASKPQAAFNPIPSASMFVVIANLGGVVVVATS
jgi:hypothetical protein